MSILVEDGSIVAGAEAYCTVDYADTYHEKRANTAWGDLDDDAKEAALRKATDYLEQVYRSRWKGSRVSATQPLSWPRGYVYLEPFIRGAGTNYPYLVDDDTVPTEVKNACAELALRASSADLSPDLDRGVLREKVGQLEVQYDPMSPQTRRYPTIDRTLAPYLNGGAGGPCVPLVRT